MYDVHGKSVGGEHKGRMQRAFDEWEKSAQDGARNGETPRGEVQSSGAPSGAAPKNAARRSKASPEQYDEHAFDDEVKDIIKNNLNSIGGSRRAPAQQKSARTSVGNGEDREKNGVRETIVNVNIGPKGEAGRRGRDGGEEDVEYKSEGVFAEQGASPEGYSLPGGDFSGGRFGAGRNETSEVRRRREDYDTENGEDIKSFAGGGEGGRQKTESDETGELDYESEEQAGEIIDNQRELQSSLALKSAACLVLTAALAFLAAAPALGISLPPIIDASNSPVCYIAVNLILLLLAGLFGFSVAFKGIASLFTLRPDSDSLVSLSFYASLGGGVFTLYRYMALAPGSSLPATAIFCSCAAAGLAFNLLGKVFLISRVKRNLKFLSGGATDGAFYSAEPVEERKARSLMRTFKGTPWIAAPQSAGFLTHFLEESYADTPADRVAAAFAPAALVVAAVAAAVELLYKKDAAGAEIAFCAVCCAASPLLFEIGAALPFARASKKLVRQRALVTGCGAVSLFGGADAVVADGNLVFPAGAVGIHSVKTFSGYGIEEAVLYAASISKAAKSPLSAAISAIIGGSAEALLHPAEKLLYEDEKGLSAIIDGKVVLLGNRGLLRHHLVEAPSRDYEMRYTADGRDVAYLAVDGRICAMFVVEYSGDAGTGLSLRRLRRYGVHLLVRSSDPNLTPQLVEEVYGVPSGDTSMLGALEMQILGGQSGEERPRAGVAFKDMAGYAAAIVSCVKLRGSLWANTIISVVLSVFGIGLVLWCAFFGAGAASVSPAYLLCYQALCALPVLILGAARSV